MERNVDGISIKVYINNLFAKWWYTNIHEWPEMIWLKENILKEGDVVCDCGANSGYTSVYFSKIIGRSGSVYAFEPHPLNVQAIYKNIEINNINNITVIPFAVGNSTGEVNLSTHPNGAITRDEKNIIKVTVVKLDDYLDKFRPTFLKIDVEGFEVEVLKGAQNILKLKPKLDLEIHCGAFENPQISVAEIYSIIDFSRYNCWVQLDPREPIIPFDKKIHTTCMIAKHNVVHLFAKPIEFSNS